MDRQCRVASKVTDYRKYYLSGDLKQVIQGKVSETVQQLENHRTDMDPNLTENATPEELQDRLKEQKDNSQKLQQQVEALKLRNELEVEHLQQQQWELALKKLQSTREIMAQQHEENMNKIRDMAEEAQEKAASANQAVAWM